MKSRRYSGLRRAGVGGDQADGVEPLAQLGIVERLGQRSVELGHLRGRRALRQQDRVPCRHVEILEALLVGGRQVRQQRRALSRQHRDRLDLALVRRRRADRDVIADVVDASGDHVRERRAAALVGHMGDFGDAHDLVQQHAGDMRGRTGAAGRVHHLALVGLGVGDELLEVVRRQVLLGHQQQRRVGDEGHRLEIVRRVIGRLLVHRVADRMGADRGEHEQVAVGRRLRHPQRAGHAAAARLVLDHDGLAQRFGQRRLQNAGERVHRPAGGERHHHGQRAARPVLRLGGRCHRERGKEQGQAERHCQEFLPV